MTAPGQEAELVDVAADLEEGTEEFLRTRPTPVTSASVLELWPELAGLGWFDLLVPEADGGLGLYPPVLGGIVRTAGRYLLPGPLLEHLFLAPFVFAATSDAASRALLRPAVSGSAFLAFADPYVGGGNPNAPRLSADGLLSGAVPLVPHAGRADVILVPVREGDAERLVLVERHDRGLHIQDRVALTSTHEVADVVFDGTVGVALPCRPELLSEVRSWLRTLSAAWLLGVAEQVLALTVDYVGQRQQFGRAVGSFQAVQHTVADMTAHVQTLGNLVSETLSQSLSGPGRVDDAAALAVNTHAGETCLMVCESGLQMHGGIGFTTDYPLHHYYKSALALRSLYGDPEDLFAELGRRVLE